MRQVSLLVMLALISLFVSCSHSDETIAREIQKEVSGDPGTQGSQLVVVVRDGKVILKGRTRTLAARERIVEIAKTKPGVWTVDDQMISENVQAPARDSSSLNTPEPRPDNLRPASTASKILVVPAGTVLAIRTKQPLGSKMSSVGTEFRGALAKSISIRGNPVIPSGSVVTGSVKEIRQPGLIKGGAVLVLGLDTITVHGDTYDIKTEVLEKGSTTEKKIDVALPVESALTFKLTQPVKVRTAVR